MTANINGETGIAFGVVNACDLPYVFDEITMEGTDHRYESAKQEIVEALGMADSADDFNKVIDDFYYRRRDDLDITDEEFAEGFDDSALSNIACEILSDTYESDGDSLQYEQETEDYHIELSSLGGAPLLWFLKSKFVAWCLQCSPCCPNAGDLNNILSDTPHKACTLAYCFDPEDYDNNGPSPFKTKPFSFNGNNNLTLVYIPE